MPAVITCRGHAFPPRRGQPAVIAPTTPVVVINGTIAAVAIPEIVADLGLGLGTDRLAGPAWAAQRRSTSPCFRIPTFRWGNVAATTVAVGEFGIIFVPPLFLVNALALSTMGAPLVVVIGLVLEVAGVAAVAFDVTPSVPPWLLAGVLVVCGVGPMLASAQLTSTPLADAGPQARRRAIASRTAVERLQGRPGAEAPVTAGASHTAEPVKTCL